MTRRKRYNLIAHRVEEGIGSDDQRTHFLLHHRRKGRLQVLLACGMDDLNPLTKFLRGRLQFRGLATGDRTSLIPPVRRPRRPSAPHPAADRAFWIPAR